MSKDEGKSDEYCQETSKPPKWLVMIYLAGDNALSPNCIDILQELEAAYPSDDVRVVACFDPNTPRPSGARYVEIGRHRRDPNPNINWPLHNDLVPFECLPGHPVEAPDFCNDNPTSVPTPTEPVAKEGLSRFINFALKYHQAEKHMLILFGHGSAVAGNTFLADNNPPSFLRLKELREVLALHFEAEYPPLIVEEESPEDEEVEDVEDEEAGDQYEDASAEEAGGKKKRPVLDILACDNCMMNGIESAFEIRRRVRYIIGSQGLMLALGWPFREILNEVVCYQDKSPELVAQRILRVCARSLLDFALMDRSSEQSLCDLKQLRRGGVLMKAVRRLSRAMQKGLAYDRCGEVKHPAVRDAIRQARLEAQSYWSETFVDLYDFCALLLERSTGALTEFFNLFQQTSRLILKQADSSSTSDADIDPRELSPFKEFHHIADACWDVLEALRGNQLHAGERRPFVLASYYVGSESQYSNGVSVYFPWTLPEAPIIFEPEPDGGSGGLYGTSWPAFERAQTRLEQRVVERTRAELAGKPVDGTPPVNYRFVTAFDEYRSYDFAKKRGGDWARFLRAFFKATLRDVRRFDLKYTPTPDKVDRFFDIGILPEETPIPFERTPINLQKSSSDVDSESDCACPTIKNYPRRFYLSPADCLRRCERPREDERCHPERAGEDKRICVSYLGWNIRGIVAEVITPPDEQEPDPSGTSGDAPDGERDTA